MDKEEFGSKDSVNKRTMKMREKMNKKRTTFEHQQS
jgi:hypothetical protein